jgi:hypothetical protein
LLGIDLASPPGGYRNVPAWEFSRFLSLVEKGKPRESRRAVPKEQAAQVEREDLEASLRWLRDFFKA